MHFLLKPTIAWITAIKQIFSFQCPREQYHLVPYYDVPGYVSIWNSQSVWCVLPPFEVSPNQHWIQTVFSWRDLCVSGGQYRVPRVGEELHSLTIQYTKSQIFGEDISLPWGGIPGTPPEFNTDSNAYVTPCIIV